MHSFSPSCPVLLLQQSADTVEHVLHDVSWGFLFKAGLARTPIKRANLVTVNVSLGISTRAHQRDQEPMVTGILSAPL